MPLAIIFVILGAYSLDLSTWKRFQRKISCPPSMGNTWQLYMVSNLYEMHLSKLSTVFKQRAKFTNAIARAFQVKAFLWMPDYFLGDWHLTFVTPLASKSPILYKLQYKNHTNSYFKHDYGVPHTYKQLSKFASHLLESLLLETNSPTTSPVEMSNGKVIQYSSYMIVTEFVDDKRFFWCSNG